MESGILFKSEASEKISLRRASGFFIPQRKMEDALSKIHQSAEVDITDPTEDDRRELFEGDRIIAQINSLPYPFKGYCSWLFLGTSEIVSALLDGRDVVAYVGELDMEDADSARQVEICIAIAGRLRRAAAAFSREYPAFSSREAKKA